MQALETATALEGFTGRRAGTDAERRAAAWLARQLAASGRETSLQTFWCRPNWALAHAWHAALALAGSLVSVASPRAGGGLILAALASLVCDAFLGVSLGRRLTPERASQNVIAAAPERPGSPRRRLVLTANYDVGRAGLVSRGAIRRAAARLRRLSGAATPGWLGWLALALIWLEVVAILRVQGHHGEAISVAQLPPTLAVVLALAALLELALAGVSPAGEDNATGVAVALALARALDATRPANLDVEVVLTGAGDHDGIGLRRFLRAHRHDHAPPDTILVGIAACSGGSVRWWRSDGRLVALRYAPRLRRLAGELAGRESFLKAARHDGRGQTPAFPARLARVPAIAIGCLDADGLVPRSRQPDERSRAAQRAAVDDALQFGLLLVEGIDAGLADERPRARLTPA